MAIQDFIQNFNTGSRANRFKIQITWPSGVTAPNVADYIVCSAAQLPSSIIGVASVPFFGRQIPVPGDRQFEDWTVTVQNDVSFSHRNAFESWSNQILSHESNVQAFANYAAMTANILVQQLDRQDKVIKTFTLQNAWPNHVSQIDLDYGNDNVVETFTVTFSYVLWASADTPTT